MSVQIGCMICGDQSPKSIDTGPAYEWSSTHRCTTEKLIAMAEERRTITRHGKMLARETERDLVIMGEMAKRLAELQAEPSGSEVLAADDAMLAFRSGTQFDMIRAMLRAARRAR